MFDYDTVCVPAKNMVRISVSWRTCGSEMRILNELHVTTNGFINDLPLSKRVQVSG